jgi:hypothetical protein
MINLIANAPEAMSAGSVDGAGLPHTARRRGRTVEVEDTGGIPANILRTFSTRLHHQRGGTGLASISHRIVEQHWRIEENRAGGRSSCLPVRGSDAPFR